MVEERRFPSPFEIETPPGAEGWQGMYPYHYLFSEERREYDEGQLWFWDALHFPTALKPWELWFNVIWQCNAPNTTAGCSASLRPMGSVTEY